MSHSEQISHFILYSTNSIDIIDLYKLTVNFARRSLKQLLIKKGRGTGPVKPWQLNTGCQIQPRQRCRGQMSWKEKNI